jgi:molybdate transport system regulatory protein
MKCSVKKKEPCIKEAEKDGFSFKGRIWIEGKEGTFLGYGRVALLERIKQYGSISEAARSMNMSYRHAWELVDSMNRQAKALLVETSTGGKGGGGAKITAEGEKAILFFQEMYERLKRFLDEESARFGL